MRVGISVTLFCARCLAAFAHGGQAGDAAPDAEAEAFVHTAAGMQRPGTPPRPDAGDGVELHVRVIDDATGRPTYCRVNVRDAGGQFYEPEDNPLASWSLDRLGNRAGKGPFRYYGWFFYSDGEFDVRVPEGDVVVEVWKGFEYRPVARRISVANEEENRLEIRLARAIDAAARGWYSGDTHLHLNRRNEDDEARALDLLAAEDIRFGYLLAMNDPKSYTGEMAAQEWPQNRGMGRASIVRRGDYAISSGQEYRCSTYGHICLLLTDDLVFRNQTLNPNEWPLFDAVGIETTRLRGAAFHAHGGYEKEIYADYVHGNTDGVELLQFAVYRGVGIEGWYHMLNAGFRYPSVGASDYPYCRAFGDCRTYARIEGEPTFEAWTRAAVEGRSFVTTGPLLFVSVEGRAPSETIELGSKNDRVRVQIELISEVAPVDWVAIVANGKVVKQFEAESGTGQRFAADIEVDESMWVTVRASGEQLAGYPDAEAHTNPVYVIRNGKPIGNVDSLQWLIDRVEERRAANAEREFPERDAVLDFFDATKRLLQNRLSELADD